MYQITKTTLESKLKEATSTLLEMARNSCWNKISENTSYIISEIKNDSRNFEVQRIEMRKENQKKEPITLEKAIAELKLIYENLYDINLEIFKSQRDKTIINIKYYPKSALSSDFYETVKKNDPMLHCKLAIPCYVNNKSKKYDVNWQHGGIRHEWKSFLNRIRFKLKYSNRIKELRNKRI